MCSKKFQIADTRQLVHCNTTFGNEHTSQATRVLRRDWLTPGSSRRLAGPLPPQLRPPAVKYNAEEVETARLGASYPASHTSHEARGYPFSTIT